MFANARGTAIALYAATPTGDSRLQDLKGITMHIKGVLHALAVAARVAILLPTVGLAWLIWNR